MRWVSDIGFNTCLLRDLQVLTELKEIAQNEPCNNPRLRAIKRINLHLISPPPIISARGGASKIDMWWSVMQELRAIGRKTGRLIGRRSLMTELPEEVVDVIG